MDDDAIAAPDWLERILDFFRTHDDTAVAVGGRVVPQWEGSRPGWLSESLNGHFSILDWGDEPFQILDEHWLAGTNMALQVASVRACGGFCEALGRIGNVLLSNEETELIRRLRRRGGRSFYDPSISITHRIDANRLTPGWIRKRIFWQVVSEAIMEQVEGGNDQYDRTVQNVDVASLHLALGDLLGDPRDSASFHEQLSALKALLRSLTNDCSLEN